MKTTDRNDTFKGLICFVTGLIVLVGCGVAYWLFSQIGKGEGSGPIIAAIAFFIGGGLFAVGVKIMTGFEFE